MPGLKDKIISTVTGDAYDKPAKTKDGAMTTQDSADAHTIEGTSADPNNKAPEIADKAQKEAEQAMDDVPFETEGLKKAVK